MEFIAGNIELEDSDFVSQLWDNIVREINLIKGITGFKTPSLGKEINETPTLIIRGEEIGIIIIDVIDENIIGFDDENEFWLTSNDNYIYSRDLVIAAYEQEIRNRLKENKELFDLRKGDFKIPINVRKYLIFAQNKKEEISSINSNVENELLNTFYGIDDYSKIFQEIKNTEGNNQGKIDIIDSIFDGSNVYSRVAKKKIEKEPENMNEFIKKSLNNTFKLDSTQRQIALQIPNGPQRIRGLAGTGKTIILCMKAALAHKFFANMKILFVFNTQSMYNQVESLITKYYFNEVKKMPNWQNLDVLHAWGGSNKPGLYYNTANSVGIRPLNFMNVRSAKDPLDAIFTDLLEKAKNKIEPIYDIVLIDEAQDFPSSFFETIFYLTKVTKENNKRIVWAYDEFQSLTDIKIKEPEELFGISEKRIPNIKNSDLEGEYKGKIKKDFVLPNSYRNPRINLMVAHGIALGLYTSKSKMPMEYKLEWEARGYTVNSPQKKKFTEGDIVIVERESRYSKNNLEKLLEERNTDNKLIQVKNFDKHSKQLDSVVSLVSTLIKEQKVEPEEILIIDLDTKNSKDEFQYLRQKLDIKNIKCITPGYIESNDAFKEAGFVTLSTPFRAKGNETNVVIIVNSQKVINDLTLRMRNAIFVSITRSRGWCYIYSAGEYGVGLSKEIAEIQTNYPKFKFTFPSEDEIHRRYTILTSSKDLEKANSEIENLFSDESLKALLLEKLSQDPKLLDEIKKLKGEK
ncbi:superfamily I DNA and RNA helicase [Algoriphagus iocasae]|uniref:Superfamily I DNA and RNA helicase n=1 Tax=Algoriphagus iocasae TaxID=1836499 RepID=A0A841M973_9BACT|nr:ATP-binding domain-containing protein [Algoriphagus iocasae]MBB6324462.1 superfamily I DNA and RNA helicase [Algoriphagus iocasae]